MSTRETFTDTGTQKPRRSFQSLSRAAVSRQTKRSRVSMRPFASKSGMNTPGLTMPSFGCRQRTRASALVRKGIFPRILNFG